MVISWLTLHVVKHIPFPFPSPFSPKSPFNCFHGEKKKFLWREKENHNTMPPFFNIISDVSNIGFNRYFKSDYVYIYPSIYTANDLCLSTYLIALSIMYSKKSLFYYFRKCVSQRGGGEFQSWRTVKRPKYSFSKAVSSL